MSTTHRVTQGECLSSIARKYGFTDYRTVYDHPDNAGFRRKRPNPNVIYPGDTLVIPDRSEKSVDLPTDQTHRFRVKVPKARLRIQLEDDEGNAYGNKKYRLAIDGQIFTGQTGADGMVDQPVPPGARKGELTLFLSNDPGVKGYVFPLDLGHLDPPEEVSGAQGRLLNLGYDCGGMTGVMDDATRLAVEAFQEKHGLTVSGSLDEATAEKLRLLHEG